MPILDETFAASFLGVPFLVVGSSISGGRKDVKKLFPGTNGQLIEDLGLMPRVHNIEAVITSNDDGEGYLANRDRFLSALESGTTGILVHPFYGSINNIVARNYTLIEDFSRLGEATFTITFALNDTTGTPEATNNTQFDIAQGAKNTGDAIATDATELYEVPKSSVNFDDALGVITDISSAFESVTPTFAPTIQALDSYSAELANLQQNVIAFVSAPQSLIDSVSNLYAGIANLYATPEDAFRVVTGFFDFGESYLPVDVKTQNQAERVANRNALVSTMQAGALIQAYTQSALIDYETVDDVDSASEAMESQYARVVDNNTQDINSLLSGLNGLSTDTLQLLSQLRAQSFEYLREEKITAARVINVETLATSTRLLAYRYYGSSELGRELADLNETDNPTFIKGDIKVLTA